MADDVSHILFRGLAPYRHRQDRRSQTVQGTVAEVAPDQGLVRVAVQSSERTVWARMDGVTALGADVQMTVTDGGVSAVASASLPVDTAPEYVGTTGAALADMAGQIADLRAVVADLSGEVAALTERVVGLESDSTGRGT